MSTRAEVIGQEQLAAGLHALPDAVEKTTELAGRVMAGRMVARMRTKVPRDTGALAATLGTSRNPLTHANEAGYMEELPYTGWIEYGGTRDRPYVAEGRTLGPVRSASMAEYVAAVSAATTAGMRSIRWPRR